MALKTLGARTFAALAFGALTLHGLDAVAPSGGVAPPSSGTGGGRATKVFGKGYPGYDRTPSVPKPPFAVDIAQQEQEQDEEAVIASVMIAAVAHYYT